jgi:hypothetical protein
MGIVSSPQEQYDFRHFAVAPTDWHTAAKASSVCSPALTLVTSRFDPPRQFPTLVQIVTKTVPAKPPITRG